MKSIIKYFPNLTSEQKQKFALLSELYQFSNDKVNVISRNDIQHLYIRHVLHSLSIARIIDFKPKTKVLDVGTGGGFPGIPLAILFPETEFMLIDSTAKKIKVVESVIKSLGLNNATAKQIRSNELKQKYDFVTGRAIANFPKFVASVKHNIKIQSFNSLQNGILYLKGGSFTDEIKNFKKNITIFQIKDFFEEDFFETKKIIHYKIR